ncbi:MAG: Dabb family protein [Phycisphaerales bacterium]
MISRSAAPLLVLATLISGCATTTKRAAVVNHPVFFVLNDPSDAAELIDDCDQLIASIPEVSSYYCGRPVDTGRATVLSDYDVGLYVGFDSLQDYAAYVDHPNHIEIVEKWRPRAEVIAVRDVLDDTP